jgi:hypothetical protein
MLTKRRVFVGLVLAIVGFLAIQLVPYGRDHTNPPVIKEPNWDSEQTRALAKRVCFDCHSHETVWPWYSNIAPMSWLIQHDVDEGRSKMNFSDWGTRKDEREGANRIQEGKMPDWKYPLLHPEAQLTEEEKQLLIRGLNATYRRR